MVILNSQAPMVRLRVLYIGSAVPLDTVAGLEAIQGPLKERYPVDSDDDTKIEGIDAFVSINNECIQLQYVNDADQVVQFPISSLSLCAAVRCVSTINTATGEKNARFVSLNDPLAGGDDAKRPAIFTAMTRRTQGRKVLECHGFICASSQDAMSLVKYASIAGKNYKQNGTIKSNRPVQQTVVSNGTTDPLLDGGSTLNRISNGSAFTPTSNVQNGVSNGTSMRLIPGEQISHVAAGPEFFEPVSTQGYFYSSNNAEVKKYNIAKLGGNRNKENVDVTQSAPSERQGPTVVNGHTHTSAHRQPPRIIPAPQPVYVRLPRQQYVVGPPRPPPPMPVFYGPPPPPMYARPRFFSPPPPRFRPQPYMMPPGGPPPMMAPPIFVRRPRGGSAGSRSRSNSSGSRGSHRSRESRSKTPTGQVNGDETEPKRIPNADDSSDSEIRVLNRQRPSTPPTDYDDRRKGERMSRRDTYEVKYGVQPSPYRYGPPPDVIPPYGYDYYVQPPRHGGYAPFTMYNPHARSRSVPGHDRTRSKSPRKKKGKKKNKKSKKNKQSQPKPQYMYYPREGFRRQPHSDVSTDSFAGYHSEIPRANRPVDSTSGYQFYPPRDFRRDENQHMNERNFSKSIKEETRRSRDSKAYPTAYELNDAFARADGDRNEDVDFNMY